MLGAECRLVAPTPGWYPISRFNAKSAIAGDEPVVWVSAEFEGGLPLSPPPPSSMARFAQKFGIGDALSPVVSFGPVSGQPFQTALDQFRQYTAANFQDPLLPSAE